MRTAAAVGTGREHGGDAGSPAFAGIGVLGGKGAIAQQRLDPGPPASGGDLGPQVRVWLARGRALAPRLREYGPPAQDATPGAQSFRGALLLDRAHAVPEFGDDLGGGTELWRDGQRYLERVGDRAVAPEEVKRPGRAERAAVQQRGQAVDAVPEVNAIDQIVEHGIGCRVHELVDHGVASDQLHDAGLLR